MNKDVFKNMRKAAGLSLRDAAARIGVHSVTLWRIENGIVAPRRSTIAKARKAYAKKARQQ